MRTRDLPTTYAEALNRLGGRDNRVIANNTRLIKFDGAGKPIVIRLHQTNVVIFWNDRTIQFFTGGWETVTTQQRINVVARAHGFTVGSNGARKPELRRWVVTDFTNREAGSESFYEGYSFAERAVRYSPSLGAWVVDAEHPLFEVVGVA